jgi:hypothetical protein
MMNETENLVVTSVDSAQTAASIISNDPIPRATAIDGHTDAAGIGDAEDDVGFSHNLDNDESPVGGVDSIAAAIEAAEEVRDPLDGLVERAGSDPGAPFEPDVLDRLVELKAENRADFLRLRQKLKNAGVGVTLLDQAIAARSGEDQPDPTQASILVELAGSAEYFHDPSGTGYADIEVNGIAKPGASSQMVLNNGLCRYTIRKPMAPRVPKQFNRPETFLKQKQGLMGQSVKFSSAWVD